MDLYLIRTMNSYNKYHNIDDCHQHNKNLLKFIASMLDFLLSATVYCIATLHEYYVKL